MPDSAEAANSIGQMKSAETFGTLYEQQAVAKDGSAAMGKTVAGGFAMGCLVTALAGSAWLRLRRPSNDNGQLTEALDNCVE